MPSSFLSLYFRHPLASIPRLYIKPYSYRQSLMGNFCAGKHEKEQTAQTIDNLNRNFTVYSFIIKGSIVVDLIIGTYHCHQSETLLAIVQRDFLDYCCEMRDYADGIEETMAFIMNQAKTVTAVAINRECPYKKLQVCVLPVYSSREADSQDYLAEFESAAREIVNGSNDITLQLTHTSESSNGLPNQTLMAILIRCLAERADSLNAKTESSTRASVSKRVRLSVIGSDMKLINLVRFEVMKTDDYEQRRVQTQVQERQEREKEKGVSQ